jgi:hypothetical protein
MNSSHLPRRIAATLLAAFAAAAIAAPAQADPPQLEQAAQAVRPDDRASRLSPSAATVRPDDRAFRGPGHIPPATPVHPNDRAARISPEAVPALPAAADGFDWTDAGIGAAGAFALVLVAAGASVAGLRSRRATALS